MRPATLIRLAVAGTRADLLRFVLTGLSVALAALAVLAAANVLAIRGGSPQDGSDGWSQQYTNALLREPGLRPGVALTLLLMTIPVLALAGQCARIGAPARDRRLSAIRLAGATPGQAMAIAVGETGVAAGAGSVLGLATYLVGHRLAHRPDALGQLPLPTDVRPPVWVLALICLGLPVVAAASAALMLRRVTIGPFGVARRARRTRAPRTWPALLIVVGPLPTLAVHWLDDITIGFEQGVPSEVISVLLVLGGLITALGIVLFTGWLSYVAGWLLLRVGRGPGALLAARALLADPWSGSRTFAALLACVLVGGGAAAQRAYFQVRYELEQRDLRAGAEAAGEAYLSDGADLFYLRSMDLVDIAVTVALIVAAAGLLVAVTEGIASRRRGYAALVATGVPRRVLGRALLWQSLAPVMPAVLLALAVGVMMQGGTGTEVTSGGYETSICQAPGNECESEATAGAFTRVVTIPPITRSVPVPLDDLALTGGLALLAVLATVGVGALLLRGATSVEELRAT